LAVGELLHTCTNGSIFLRDEGKLLNWLKKRFTYKKAAGIHLAAYAAHAWKVRLQQGGTRPGAGAGMSGGVELGGTGDNYIEVPGYSSM
jgi:hypothetical protein